MTPPKFGALALSLVALIGLGTACASEAGSSTSEPTEAAATPDPTTPLPEADATDDDVDRWALQGAWDLIPTADQKALCDALADLGYDWGGEQISIGSGGEFTAAQGADFLRSAC